MQVFCMPLIIWFPPLSSPRQVRPGISSPLTLTLPLIVTITLAPSPNFSGANLAGRTYPVTEYSCMLTNIKPYKTL